jgi:S1-C subfamily serine protease
VWISTLVTVFILSVAAWSGEKGELGLRLQPAGLAWRVVGISPHSAAAKAGLQIGDIVIQIDNLFLPSADQLRRIIAGLKQGDLIKISTLGPDGPVDHLIRAEPSSKEHR